MDFNELKGMKLVSIEGAKKGSGEIRFLTDDGLEFLMYHVQDCCEDVRVEEVIGDINDLLDSEIIEAEVVESREDEAGPIDSIIYNNLSFTWTFYKLGTKKGFVTFRWLGESNGYYSESVNFKMIYN